MHVFVFTQSLLCAFIVLHFAVCMKTDRNSSVSIKIECKFKPLLLSNPHTADQSRRNVGGNARLSVLETEGNGLVLL